MALSPFQVYQDLLAAGASTVEAIGILANSINESGINPEPIGDQGTSFGFVQEHGNYSYLVTGNPSADIQAQINLLKSQGGFGDASGTTGAQAAGNFAAKFEKCVGCQPGGAQYSSRVANAAKVEGWIQSGNWPTSAGSATPGGTPTQTASNIFTDPFGTLFGDLSSGFLSALGIGSIKDLLERLGLIILGFALILLGIHLLAGGGRKQPFNINVSESKGPEGTSRTRRVNTPVGSHTSTVKAGGAIRSAEKTGAKRAVEAAAVALQNRIER